MMLRWALVAHAYSPSSPEAEVCVSFELRAVESTKESLGWPGLHEETVSTNKVSSCRASQLETQAPSAWCNFPSV